MVLRVGELVTVMNPRTGKPYKRYFGLLTKITDSGRNKQLAKVSTRNRNFPFCVCEIEWLTRPYIGRGNHNATYVAGFKRSKK